MATAIMSYFGFGGPTLPATKPIKPTKPQPVRALPASWYTSPDMYNLEKRAIFTRRWQLITHKCRFTETIDWLKFDVAGYEFVLYRDESTRRIKGFHNVTKDLDHRIVEEDSGSLQDIPNFNEIISTLHPIHVRVDDKSFIWINLDAAETPSIPWEEDFNGIDMQERYSIYNFDDYVLDHVWQMEGAYNWKICADNFNECYHCPTSHPDIPALLDIETLDTKGEFGWIKHKSVQDEKQKADGLGIASTYFYPNVSISVL